MSRFTHQMTSYWQQMLSVMRNEFRTIFTDAGVVLILVLALIILRHRLLDGLRGAGAPQRADRGGGRMPHADQPQPDRDLQRRAEHRRGLQSDEHGGGEGSPSSNARFYGVVYIPSDYEEKLLGGPQANVAIYADASYFLMYRQVFQEVVTSIGAMAGAMVEFQRLIAKGAQPPAGAGHDPAGHLPVPTTCFSPHPG